jgi:hypothetical protein
VSAAVIALALLLGLAAWRVFGGYPATAPGVALSRRELAALDALADAVFPGGGALGRSGREGGVARHVDGLIAVSAPRQRLLMRLLFFLLEHGTLLFPAPGGLAGLRRCSALSEASRVAWLEGWRTSGLFARRLVFTSLRAVLTLGYFADPVVQRQLGLAPFEIASPVCAADLLYPRIGASRASIALGPADLTPPSDGSPLVAGEPLR